MTTKAYKYNPDAKRTGRGIYCLNDLRDRCRIDSESGCWNWSMTALETASGSVVPRVSVPANVFHQPKLLHATGPRVSWLLSGRSIREGWIVWRACVNGLCLNPAHLKAGTHADEGAWQRANGHLRGDPRRAAVNRANGRSLAIPAEKFAQVKSMLESGIVRSEIQKASGVSRGVVKRIAEGTHIHQRATLVRGASVFAQGVTA